MKQRSRKRGHTSAIRIDWHKIWHLFCHQALASAIRPELRFRSKMAAEQVKQKTVYSKTSVFVLLR